MIRPINAASRVPGIEKVDIIIREGQELVPLPEGNQYPGYLFARADTPQQVVSALRAAHAKLNFAVAPVFRLRAEADLRNEKINYKVREHSVAKVPAILVVGAREQQESTVAVRRLGGQSQEILALESAIARLCEEAAGPLARK